MSTTATSQTSKRRSRASVAAGNSGDDSKKRGRPRVDKADQSAADRRRTQIRNAQRAYRQRKEGTLEELRKRVSELTNTIELMNKAFLDCADRLAQAGLPHSQMQDMRETTMQYEALMRCARNPDMDCDPDVTESIERMLNAADPGTDTPKSLLEPRNVPSWMDENVLNAPLEQTAPFEVGMGYTMYMQPVDDTNSSTSHCIECLDSFAPPSKSLVQSRTRQDQKTLKTFGVDLSDAISLPRSLTPPRTYSFQESTFGRRLHRACLEEGYRLLLDPDRRPATYERVFRLSLMTKNKEKLIKSMKTLLDQGPQDSLDLPNSLIHVGGAGTHFPRRDHFGNLVRPKQEPTNLGVVSPGILALLENAARGNVTIPMTVEIDGFEGEWFDAYDVEGYLQEKGIYIDPSLSFAEAEVPVDPSTSSTASIGTAQTAIDLVSARDPIDMFLSQCKVAESFEAEQLEYPSRNHIQSNEHDPPNVTGIGFSDATTGSWMNFLQPGEATLPHSPAETNFYRDVGTGTKYPESLLDQPTTQASIPQKTEQPLQLPPKKVIILDVAKFVKVLTGCGICLGRTPAFRRSHVDRALALSSFDTF